MRKRFCGATLICVLCCAVIIAVAFFAPSITMRALETAAERTVWLAEKDQMAEGSNLSVAQKMKLITGSYVTLYNGWTLSEEDVITRARSELIALAAIVPSHLAPTEAANVFSETRLYVTGIRSAVLWYVAFSDGAGCEAECIVDDETGLLLCFRMQGQPTRETLEDKEAVQLSDTCDRLSSRLGLKCSGEEEVFSKNSDALRVTCSDWVDSVTMLVRKSSTIFYFWPETAALMNTAGEK